MRLDPEARRARRHQTCWRAAGELARRRRVLRSGIAPRKAAPAAPPPARPPPRTATARGAPDAAPGPRCGCACLGAGEEYGAPPLPQVALGAGIWFSFARGAAGAAATTTGSTGAGVL